MARNTSDQEGSEGSGNTPVLTWETDKNRNGRRVNRLCQVIGTNESLTHRLRRQDAEKAGARKHRLHDRPRLSSPAACPRITSKEQIKVRIREKVLEEMPPFPGERPKDRPIPEWMFWGGMISFGVLIFTWMFVTAYQGMTH